MTLTIIIIMIININNNKQANQYNDTDNKAISIIIVENRLININYKNFMPFLSPTPNGLFTKAFQ